MTRERCAGARLRAPAATGSPTFRRHSASSSGSTPTTTACSASGSSRRRCAHHGPPPDRARSSTPPSHSRALNKGQAQVSGSAAIDGVAATQISWPADASTDPTSRNILYVNTATGVPLAYAWGGGKLDATGGVVAQQRYPTYEFLPEDPATTRALSESAAHPDATLMPPTSQRQLDASFQNAERTHCGSVG